MTFVAGHGTVVRRKEQSINQHESGTYEAKNVVTAVITFVNAIASSCCIRFGLLRAHGTALYGVAVCKTRRGMN